MHGSSQTIVKRIVGREWRFRCAPSVVVCIYMLTVPEAARRVGKDPETVRRWIRSGKLRARKVGTQHVIEEHDLDVFTHDEDQMLPLPKEWRKTTTGEPMPNVVRLIRLSRRGH